MRLVHTTFLSNLESIKARGILTSYAEHTGLGQCIWLHEASMNSWAEVHVRDRHDREDASLVHITVEVPDHKLTKHGSGRYYTAWDINPDQFTRILSVSYEDMR